MSQDVTLNSRPQHPCGSAPTTPSPVNEPVQAQDQSTADVLRMIDIFDHLDDVVVPLLLRGPDTHRRKYRNQARTQIAKDSTIVARVNELSGIFGTMVVGLGIRANKFIRKVAPA